MAEVPRVVRFSIIFTVIFAGIVGTMPTGFLGAGIEYEDSSEIIPDIDSSLITGFADYTNFSYSAYSGVPLNYLYDFNSLTWESWQYSSNFFLSKRVIYFGTFWLGQYEVVTFTSENGTSRGNSLSFDEIDGDDLDGTVRYTLKFQKNGQDAGTWLMGWNSTAYATPALAWVADELSIVHGVGLEETAPANALNLVVGLLFFSLPYMPPLLSLIFGVAVWSGIVLGIWYLVKESMPFV